MAGIPRMVQPATQVPIPLGQVGNILVIAPHCHTIQQFYEDTSKDPCQGDYARILQRFDP
jgi:hypothetical protein